MESYFIECESCGCDFEFTTKEQQAYFEKNFDEPRRCPECRRNRSRAKDFERIGRRRRKDFDWAHVM